MSAGCGSCHERIGELNLHPIVIYLYLVFAADVATVSSNPFRPYPHGMRDRQHRVSPVLVYPSRADLHIRERTFRRRAHTAAGNIPSLEHADRASLRMRVEVVRGRQAGHACAEDQKVRSRDTVVWRYVMAAGGIAHVGREARVSEGLEREKAWFSSGQRRHSQQQQSVLDDHEHCAGCRRSQ
jgi:hypothetical protein